jgi:hypothetical protein
MNTHNAVEDLRHRAAIYQQAAEYIAENFDEDEDVDIDEIVRDIERGNAERFAELGGRIRRGETCCRGSARRTHHSSEHSATVSSA